jgi:hypothetical protein
MTSVSLEKNFDPRVGTEFSSSFQPNGEQRRRIDGKETEADEGLLLSTSHKKRSRSIFDNRRQGDAKDDRQLSGGEEKRSTFAAISEWASGLWKKMRHGKDSSGESNQRNSVGETATPTSGESFSNQSESQGRGTANSGGVSLLEIESLEKSDGGPNAAKPIGNPMILEMHNLVSSTESEKEKMFQSVKKLSNQGDETAKKIRDGVEKSSKLRKEAAKIKSNSIPARIMKLPEKFLKLVRDHWLVTAAIGVAVVVTLGCAIPLIWPVAQQTFAALFAAFNWFTAAYPTVYTLLQFAFGSFVPSAWKALSGFAAVDASSKTHEADIVDAELETLQSENFGIQQRIASCGSMFSMLTRFLNVCSGAMRSLISADSETKMAIAANIR